MSKDKFTSILNGAFDNGIPFINFTQYYSYALIPQASGKWREVSFDFEEKEIMDDTELEDSMAFAKLCEEVEKSMSAEIEDFMLIKWKELKAGMSGSDGDKLRAGIADITGNPTTYSKNLPVILSKDGLPDLIAKL